MPRSRKNLPIYRGNTLFFSFFLPLFSFFLSLFFFHLSPLLFPFFLFPFLFFFLSLLPSTPLMRKIFAPTWTSSLSRHLFSIKMEPFKRGWPILYQVQPLYASLSFVYRVFLSPLRSRRPRDPLNFNRNHFCNFPFPSKNLSPPLPYFLPNEGFSNFRISQFSNFIIIIRSFFPFLFFLIYLFGNRNLNDNKRRKKIQSSSSKRNDRVARIYFS